MDLEYNHIVIPMKDCKTKVVRTREPIGVRNVSYVLEKMQVVIYRPGDLLDPEPDVIVEG